MGNHNGNNGNGFKKGFDANRYISTGNSLTVHKEKVGYMLRHCVDPKEITDYLHYLLTDKSVNANLGFKVAKTILNLTLGTPLNVAQMYELEKLKASDRSLSHYSNEEIREQITTLEKELFSRDRIEIILNEYEQSLNE